MAFPQFPLHVTLQIVCIFVEVVIVFLFFFFSYQLCTLGFYVTFNVVKFMFCIAISCMLP